MINILNLICQTIRQSLIYFSILECFKTLYFSVICYSFLAHANIILSHFLEKSKNKNKIQVLNFFSFYNIPFFGFLNLDKTVTFSILKSPLSFSLECPLNFITIEMLHQCHYLCCPWHPKCCFSPGLHISTVPWISGSSLTASLQASLLVITQKCGAYYFVLFYILNIKQLFYMFLPRFPFSLIFQVSIVCYWKQLFYVFL